MKSKMDKYNLILVGLFMFLVILTILWKMPQKEDRYVHVGIAAYDLDDTFMESYIKDLQDKMEQMKIEGKKVSYEIYDAKGSSRKQEKAFLNITAFQRHPVWAAVCLAACCLAESVHLSEASEHFWSWRLE